MRRLIKKIVPCFAKVSAQLASFRRPKFECREKARSVDLHVFVPGVEPEHVDLVVDDRDLVVIARKSLPVRPNWHSARFEAVQEDYQLRVRLDGGVDATRTWAAWRDGILTIHLRKTRANVHPQLSVA